jgi:hypothetical protein
MSERSPQGNGAGRAGTHRPARTGMTLPLMVFVLFGAPLVLYVWETLSALLAGHLEVRSLAIALVLGMIFLSAATVLGRHLRRIEASSAYSMKESADDARTR